MIPKESVILLHGAIGASSQLNALKEKLSADYTVYSFDFEGHGGRASDNDFSIELFVQNTLDFMEENQIGSATFFGYSMGGYVALKLAATHPGKVKSITTYGTKFDWTPEAAEKETKMMNPEKIEEKVPAFAQSLKELHYPLDWKENMKKTAAMMLALGNQPALSSTDIKSIRVPVNLCLGDQDQMVTQEETKNISDQISDSSFHLIADSAHPIYNADLDQLTKILSGSVKMQETQA